MPAIPRTAPRLTWHKPTAGRWRGYWVGYNPANGAPRSVITPAGFGGAKWYRWTMDGEHGGAADTLAQAKAAAEHAAHPSPVTPSGDIHE